MRQTKIPGIYIFIIFLFIHILPDGSFIEAKSGKEDKTKPCTIKNEIITNVFSEAFCKNDFTEKAKSWNSRWSIAVRARMTPEANKAYKEEMDGLRKEMLLVLKPILDKHKLTTSKIKICVFEDDKDRNLDILSDGIHTMFSKKCPGKADFEKDDVVMFLRSFLY